LIYLRICLSYSFYSFTNFCSKPLKMGDSDMEGGDWDWDDDNEDDNGKDRSSSLRRSSQSLAVKRSSSFSSSEEENKAMALRLQSQGKNINIIGYSAAPKHSVVAPKRPLPSKPSKSMKGFGNIAPTSGVRPSVSATNPTIRPAVRKQLSKPNDDDIFASVGMNTLGSTRNAVVGTAGIRRPLAASLVSTSLGVDEIDGSWGDDDDLEDDLFDSDSD